MNFFEQFFGNADAMFSLRQFTSTPHLSEREKFNKYYEDLKNKFGDDVKITETKIVLTTKTIEKNGVPVYTLTYVDDGTDSTSIADLEKMMQDALKEEDYERCAQLKKAIHNLKNKEQSGKF